MQDALSERRPVIPSPKEVEQAKISSRLIEALAAKATPKRKYSLTDHKGTEIELSESAFLVLVDALKTMACGHAVMLVPVEAEVTTQQAAEILNVSRPYLIELLEKGEIAFHKVGRYRRIKHQDVLDYQQLRATRRKENLDELVAQAQKLNLGY